MERFSVLKGSLKRKEEALELSKGVEAKYSDLQSQVVQLESQLDGCQFEIDALRRRSLRSNRCSMRQNHPEWRLV